MVLGQEEGVNVNQLGMALAVIALLLIAIAALLRGWRP